MLDEQRTKLLFGPYHPPAVGIGDVVRCHYRDDEVVVVDWTMAPIPWPLCRRPPARGGGRGLLVEDELAPAVRSESAAAVMHWWGASASVVIYWRKALGAGRKNNPGSRRLIRAAVTIASAQSHAPLTPDQVEERRRRLSQRNAEAGNPAVYQRAAWTAEELALLGTMPDTELAVMLGRTFQGVQVKRERLGIACYRRMAG